MKLIIAGGRDFKDYELLKTSVLNFMKNHQVTHIVSGGQSTYDPETRQRYGADYLGEKFAREMGLPIRQYKANWASYGRAAGPIRNRLMASVSEAVMAFWDGKSRGTKNMIETAVEKGLIVEIVSYENTI